MPDLRLFLEAFIPLFVAIDPPGLVPLFLSVTGDMPADRRRRVSLEAVTVALAVGAGFMLVGQVVFRFLGIDEADFKIAGGLVLLVLAVLDILSLGKPAVHEADLVGIVPLAMPLIAGPAMLTTLLVLANRPDVGQVMTLAALVANLFLVAIALLSAQVIVRIVGSGAMRGISKIGMLLLAAIAVSFIRSGLAQAMAMR